MRYEARAEQMALAPHDSVQPRADREGFADADYETSYSRPSFEEDLSSSISSNATWQGRRTSGPTGIHGKLLDRYAAEGELDWDTNPKPATFGQNVVGNRSGATMDTHAIRGVLMTLNQMEPGGVPEGFILPSAREAYRQDPTRLTPSMIDDTLGSQMVDGRSMQTEYPVFADIMHAAAERLGVSPAEAQSMAWFGFGDETNLGSAANTVSELFDQRLDVTAEVLGIPTEEAARLVFTRQIPLLANRDATVGAAALMAPEDDEQEDIPQFNRGGLVLSDATKGIRTREGMEMANKKFQLDAMSANSKKFRAKPPSAP
jgi:hypothetical protein